MSVVEHKCTPRLSIPYNPIPQDSMEIYSADYPDIVHEPNCVELRPFNQKQEEEVDSDRSESPHSVKSFYLREDTEVLIQPSPEPEELTDRQVFSLLLEVFR